jgi:hypothetical protein
MKGLEPFLQGSNRFLVDMRPQKTLITTKNRFEVRKSSKNRPITTRNPFDDRRPRPDLDPKAVLLHNEALLRHHETLLRHHETLLRHHDTGRQIRQPESECLDHPRARRPRQLDHMPV